MSLHNEIEFENEICEHLAAHGWLYADKDAATTAVLAAEAERAIELLQERRTALISAAVTGKIDVREFACEGAV